MPTSAYHRRVPELAMVELGTMAELKPDPRGAHGLWKWVKASAGGMQGQVCHQQLLEWASLDLSSLSATPGKTSKAGTCRGP